MASPMPALGHRWMARATRRRSAERLEILQGRRDIIEDFVETISQPNKHVGIVLGASGVGKTTAARQIISELHSQKKWHVWEHIGAHVLRSDYWSAIAKALDAEGRTGVVFIDDAHQHLQQINELVDDIVSRGITSLKLLLVSSIGNWYPRVKSPSIFRICFERKMSKLSSREIDGLLNLVDSQPKISALIETTFAGFSRNERKRRLQDRCEAETFVCLKNIFASEGFDAIILREFNQLNINVQPIYRYVAFLESAGVHVHRQLLVRLLGIGSDQIASVLAQLADVVSEYEIERNDGIFGWRGRHPVITGIVTKYKFSSLSEVKTAFNRVIDCINPAFSIEIRSLRELCSLETGIARLPDRNEQNFLLRRMISVAPGERVPRHRLISNLIELREFDQASTEIRIFVKDFKKDGPVSRYEVDLTVARATRTEGLTTEDRRVILEDANALAQAALGRFPTNKGVLKSYCDLGIAFYRLVGEVAVFDSAIDALKKAEAEVGDPDLTRLLARYEHRLSKAAIPIQRADQDQDQDPSSVDDS